MKKTTSLIQRILNSRLLWAAVSLLASFALWIYIASVETDEYTVNLTGVQVQFVGEETLRDSKNLVITDLDTATVNLRVSGPRRTVTSLRAQDVVAQIDVSRLTQPAYTSQQYTLVFPSNINESELTVERRTPSTVNFMVSTLTSVPVNVRGSFDGNMAEGVIAESPVFEPSVITVSGPEVYLRDIDCAWVSFGQDIVAEKTYSLETSFTLLNSEKEPCSVEYLSFSDETVTATLPVQETKVVTLGVNLLYGSAANETRVKVKVEPETVTLTGDSAILNDVNRLTLATIDVTDFASTFTETYTIPIPNELTNLTGITEATVTVEVVGLETRTFSVTNLSYINPTEGMEVEILTEAIDVRLRAAPELLDEIRSENLRAVADLEDYVESTGTYLATVRFYVDGFTEVDIIGEASDYTISVEIRKAS